MSVDIVKKLLRVLWIRACRGFTLMCVANLSDGASSRPIHADFLFVRTSKNNPPHHDNEQGHVA